jgi:hypothetical protein
MNFGLGQNLGLPLGAGVGVRAGTYPESPQIRQIENHFR